MGQRGKAEREKDLNYEIHEIKRERSR